VSIFNSQALKENDHIVRTFIKDINFPKFSNCSEICNSKCNDSVKVFSNVCTQSNNNCYMIKKRVKLTKCNKIK
jgi:hypothetical protein